MKFLNENLICVVLTDSVLEPFSMAFETLYQFIWHRYADYYIEELKESLRNGNIKVLEILRSVYFENLVMLHPFMPFVTEAVWRMFHGEKSSILQEKLDY